MGLYFLGGHEKLVREHVTSHLTAGCEVARDIRPSAAHDLQDVQTAYLRRALNISRCSQLPPLYTETGIWPIRYCSAYLVDRPALVGMALPVPVLLDVSAFPTQESVQQALSELSTSLAAHLWDAVTRSNRLPVLQYRALRAVPQTPTASDLKVVCMPRAYLSLPHRRQREALALLLFSEHPLAGMEQLRRMPPILREWRICRFCRIRSAIEDEIHALHAAPLPVITTQAVYDILPLTTAS
ncbi:hypothetical protein BN946_scf184915.g35 [Trametes cinnabarina]|uniref:Uncharacterized protein n=1 Tax=Pycnoporus cinnabarinus TaxID=5643 RepID=A0A060SBS1_PYCCI|nr:hypothetical protein BN946_scf184915.g35 [Trametes cinnabarina]